MFRPQRRVIVGGNWLPYCAFVEKKRANWLRSVILIWVRAGAAARRALGHRRVSPATFFQVSVA